MPEIEEVSDIEKLSKIKPGEIIQVQDHINRTGTNVLMGRQKPLGIDFIDMTNIYQNQQYSIITDCCGETLNNKYEYPSHYICHITTLAHALKIKNIYGFLICNYNIFTFFSFKLTTPLLSDQNTTYMYIL